MNHTINNHLNQAGQEIFGRNIMPTTKEYKFTVRYQNGSKSEPIIKATSRKEAVRSLSYWFPGCIEILGCRETEL